MSIFRNVIGTFLANVTSIFLGFLISVITSRMLGIEGRGIFTVINTTIVLISTVCNFGINQSIAYYVSKDKNSKLFYFSALMLQGLFSTVVVFIFLLLNDIFISVLKISKLDYFWMVLCIPLALMLPVIRYFFVGINKINKYNILNILEKILNILVICLIFVTNIDIGLMFLIPLVITFVVGIFISKESLKISFNKNIIKNLFQYGIGNYIGLIANFLSYRIAIFIINFFLTIEQVGIYSISMVLAELFFIIPNTLNVVLFKKIAQSNNVTDYYNKMLRVSNGVMIIGLVLFIIFGKQAIILIYSEQFAAAYFPSVILLSGILGANNFRLFSNLFIAQGRVQIYSKCGLVNMASTIILDLFLIPYYGLLGAAFASFFSYMLTYLYAFYNYKVIYNVRIKDTLIITKKDFVEFSKLINAKRIKV